MKKIFSAAAIILSAMFMWNAGENTARRDFTKNYKPCYKAVNEVKTDIGYVVCPRNEWAINPYTGEREKTFKQDTISIMVVKYVDCSFDY